MSALRINIVLFGIGNVGSTLINQVIESQKFFLEKRNIDLRFPIITNSTLAFFEKEGIKNQWEANFAQSAIPFRIEDIIEYVQEQQLENLIAVDASASSDIVKNYIPLIQNGFDIVAANKKANTIHTDFYKELRRNLKKHDKSFLYETNVGAGLPIIDTLKHLIASGDKVNKIQAVLSGSLNFIFNNFSETYNFHDVVKEAGVQGFTEPDPKIDLSGVDVARKILILIRESGYKMDIKEIENNCFLPKECMDTTNNDDFFKSLTKHDAHFNKLLEDAKSKDSRIKFVAKFDNGKASVGLQFIPKESPFYNLEGKDNIVEFYTERYIDQPLIIKGAGAGAAVTASGIFADVIRIGNV
jgi:aspartokinase/homoserine dehydrogenase 1